MSLLLVKELRKNYGSIEALSGASFVVERGKIHGLIGPNGSGKSTLLKCIAGAERANGGTISFKGNDITTKSVVRRAQLGLAITFQITTIFPQLSVMDNIILAKQRGKSRYGLPQKSTARNAIGEIESLIADVGLADKALVIAGELSHGQQQWLEIAMVLSQMPELLLLDEPTAGMNREERGRTVDLLRRVGHNSAIVIVEHDLGFVRELCDEISIMHHGRIVARGATEEIVANAEAKGVFLGRAFNGTGS